MERIGADQLSSRSVLSSKLSELINIMPFSKEAVSMIGTVIRVVPYHGYGWTRRDTDDADNLIDCPSEFGVRLREFVEDGMSVVAAAGIVEQPGHSMNGLEIWILPRPQQIVGFNDPKANFNLLICPGPPCLTGEFEPPHPDSVRGSGFPEYRGYAAGIFAPSV